MDLYLIFNLIFIIFLLLFLNQNREKGVYLPQDCEAGVAREADVARRTRTDATRHTRPPGRANAREGRHVARGAGSWRAHGLVGPGYRIGAVTQ